MSLRANIAITKLFWWKSVDSTKMDLMNEWHRVAWKLQQSRKKYWNGSFYRPIESSRFRFLTLTHFCIPRKKSHERDLNIQGWMVYLFAWCFSVISFSFDSLVYSFSISVGARERERITLLQCMFVQCLCIPTIWHHYVRSSISFILFITFCCVARHRTTLFYASLLSSAFDIIIFFLFSLFTASFYVYSLYQWRQSSCHCGFVWVHVPLSHCTLSALGIDYRGSIAVCCTKADIMLSVPGYCYRWILSLIPRAIFSDRCCYALM